MNVFSRSSAVAGLAAVALAVSGCGGTNDVSGMSMSSSSVAAATTGSTGVSGPTTAPSSTSMSKSMSGMPGMSGSSSGASTTGGAGAEHNAADVMFAQMMIEHHRGAIEMAQLVPDRAASQQVKDLAARIEAAQAPEIDLMTGWLESWDAAMARMSTGGMDMGDSGMDMGGTSGMEMSTRSGMTNMPGMMTADQMAALTAATGADFDRMFLEMMIEHHQGAVEMADTEIADGTNPEALALAASIKSSQTAEITEMQQLLQGS